MGLELPLRAGTMASPAALVRALPGAFLPFGQRSLSALLRRSRSIAIDPLAPYKLWPMNGLVKLRLIRPAAAKPAADLEPRCTHALELLLASPGNPSLEVENALAIDPHSSCMGSSRSPPLDVKRPSRRLSLRFAGRWFCGLAGRLGEPLMQPLCEALRAFAAGL